MPPNTETQLARSARALLVAPAGCGKTETIARAVAVSRGRQLILTHTHAGVKALKLRLRDIGVSSDQFKVETLDGFSLRYALYFPSHSGYSITAPSNDQWDELRKATVRTFHRKASQRLVQASYDTAFTWTSIKIAIWINTT